MPETSASEIRVFYCYAREDKAIRRELEIHLADLIRHYHLTAWSDHEILPGEDFDKAIDAHLSTADLVFLLISPYFMYSDYCYSKEMALALERHQEGTCCVIPILLHPTYWVKAPFSHLQLLPTNAKAITSWPNRHEAFHDVAKGIGVTLENLPSAHQRGEKWLNKGKALSVLNRFDEAIQAYDQAIRLTPSYSSAYVNKAIALTGLKRFDEAKVAHQKALELWST